MASVKGNIFLNCLNTVAGIIFPIITFPYAARILLPEGIGIVNFLFAIINYIVLLTGLGIPLYGVKEIAKHQDDKSQRDKIAVELLLLSFSLCFLGYILVWILASFVPEIRQHTLLFWILSLAIVFNTLGVSWFYQGIEDFKFITIRAIAIRTLSAVSLFIFVRNPSDLIIYAIITVCSTVGNNLINFIHLRHYLSIDLAMFRQLRILRHLRPSLKVFALNLIISLYVQLNPIMLGFMGNETAVGYFTTGNKIIHICLVFINSITMALLPRCSHFHESGQKDEFRRLVFKTFRVVIALGLPLVAGLIILVEPITLLFFGSDFLPAIPVVYWDAFIILFVSLTGIMGIQVLYSIEKVGIVIWSVIAGAITNIILNILLIPIYGATGAAIATFASELAVLIFQIILGHTYIPFRYRSIQWHNYAVAMSIMVGVTLPIVHYCASDISKLIGGGLIGALVYAGTLWVIKDSLFHEMISMLRLHRFRL